MKRLRSFLTFAAVLAGLTTAPMVAVAQFQGGGGGAAITAGQQQVFPGQQGGGQFGGGQFGGGQFGGQFGGGQTGGRPPGGQTGGFGQQGGFGTGLAIEPDRHQFNDTRLQPFVGPSSDMVFHPLSRSRPVPGNLNAPGFNQNVGGQQFDQQRGRVGGTGGQTGARTTGFAGATGGLAGAGGRGGLAGQMGGLGGLGGFGAGGRGGAIGGLQGLFGQGAFGGGRGGGRGGRGGFGAGMPPVVRSIFAPGQQTVPAAVATQVSGQLSTQITERLRRLPAIRPFADEVQVSVSNRVATITGQVETPDQAHLIERQVRLEPGVSQVVNLLQLGN